MRLKLSVLFGLSLLLSGTRAYAGDASEKLNELAETLISQHSHRGSESPTTIAVFPFTCDEKLQKQRVGFAVSELISHRFARENDYILLERGEVDRLLTEQKMQASGAVDSGSAVQIGKLLSAKALVLGNITKLGAKYQVNARLVSVETGAVLSAAFTETPISALETDARSYLNLVPEVQSVGIYFLSATRNNPNSIPTQTINSIDYGWTQLNPTPFQLSFVGLGIRYAPTRHILADFAYMATPEGRKAGIEGTGIYKIRAKSIRALLNYKGKASKALAYYLGAGVTSFIISINENTKPSYITPTLQLRGEYFIQSRIGISFSAGYDLLTKSIQQKKWGTPPSNPKVAELGHFYLEPSLSLYF